MLQEAAVRESNTCNPASMCNTLSAINSDVHSHNDAATAAHIPPSALVAMNTDDFSCGVNVYHSRTFPADVHALHACGHMSAHAVCEAYTEEGGSDGAEIFRDEGEGRPEGPGVPEGALAGVIVVQPDGSPCIGWLVAHPAIVRSCFFLRFSLFLCVACALNGSFLKFWMILHESI
jgi:hypothetical protein